MTDAELGRTEPEGWVSISVSWLAGRTFGQGGDCGDGRPGGAAITAGSRWADPTDAAVRDAISGRRTSTTASCHILGDGVVDARNGG
jgi:hypothetical protein